MDEINKDKIETKCFTVTLHAVKRLPSYPLIALIFFLHAKCDYSHMKIWHISVKGSVITAGTLFLKMLLSCWKTIIMFYP